MNGMADWQEANSRYLAAALHWLRLRLYRLAEARAETPARAEPEAGGGWFHRPRRQSPCLPALKNPDPRERDLGAAADAMAEAAGIDPPPALILLARCFGLSRFEQEVLLLAAAVELDPAVPALCAQALGDAARPAPSFALAFSLFDEPEWAALAADRPLRYWRLLEINQPGATPLTASALRADERIVNYVKGLNSLDDRLAPWLSPCAGPGTAVLPASQRAVADAIARHLERAADSGAPVLFQLLGADASSKQWVAHGGLRQAGLQPLRLAAESIPGQGGDLETFIRLWQRECQLLPLALYLDSAEETEAHGQEAALRRLLGRCRGVVLLDSREPRQGLGSHAHTLEVAKPLPGEQQATWGEALGAGSEALAARLAGQFDLNLPAIADIAAEAADDAGEDTDLEGRVWRACLLKTRPGLDRLAERIDAKAQWEALVLPAESSALLRTIAVHVEKRGLVYDAWGFRDRMNRGLGISALFAGESGTGKTMAAEVIANELRLNLYRIDLSAVVSKYIGETEKNLRRVFDAAEDGGAILFFDEADALFGKRSEVKDSHDRYANIEINYLLQRMEAYRGLAVLATNMKSALDQAFLRRLRFIVQFPFPGVPERRRMWARVFPGATPIRGLDFDRLAKFNLTGGSIHNIALNAAFMAARTPEAVVTMPLLFEAIRLELRKLEKPVNEAEFRLVQAMEAGR